MAQCPGCGYANPDEAAFCSLCYAVLKKELRASSPEVAHGVAGVGEARPNSAGSPSAPAPAPASGGTADILMAQQLIAGGNAADLPRALELADRGLAALPPETLKLPPCAVFWTVKGICLNRLGRKEEALKIFDLALELDPGYAIAWNNRGNTLDDLGRLEESLAAYDKAVALDPRDANSFCDRGYVLRKLKRVEEAVASYDQALKLAPNHLLAWNNKGNALLALKRWKDAVACYDQVLGIAPTHQNARASREHALAQLGQAPASRPVNNPQAQEFYRQAGELLQQGRVEEALAAQGRALTAEPHPDGWANKAAMLKRLGRLEEALVCYDEGLRLVPGHAMLWYNKANTYFALNLFEEAVAAYDKCLEADPASIGAWNNKGAAYGNLGREIEAYLCFSRAVKISPNYEKAVEGMNRLKAQLGPFAPPEGFQDCDLSVEPIPPNELKHLTIKAGGLIRLKLFEEALRYCDKALALDSRFGQAWLGRALGLLGLGLAEESAVSLHKALKATPLLPDAWVLMGWVQREAGRPGRALAAFERAAFLLAKGPEGLRAAVQQAARSLVEAGASGDIDFLREYLTEGAPEAAPEKPSSPRAPAPAPAAPPAAAGGSPKTALQFNEEGAALFNQKSYAEAVACYDQALALEPRYGIAWSNKGNALFAMGRGKEAGPCYERAILAAPIGSDAWYSKAFVEKSLAEWPRSLRSYERFLALARPEQADLVAKARGYQQELLAQGVAPGPKEALVLVSEGFQACAADRIQEGVALFDQALRSANWAEVWHYKGMGLASLGNDEEALRCHDQAVGLDPTLARAWYDRGVVLGRQGKQADAVKSYTQAVSHAPAMKEAWSNMGRLLGSMGRIQESLACVDKALALDPRSPIIWMNKALAEDSLQRFAEARRSYQEFLKYALPEHARQIDHAKKRLSEMP